MAQAKRDQNNVTTLIGVSSADGVTPTLVYVDPTTHRVLVDNASAITFVDNEVVSGSGTAFTLANTPTLGSEHIFAGRQRLYPTTDYSISGASITTILSWSTGDLLADYRH